MGPDHSTRTAEDIEMTWYATIKSRAVDAMYDRNHPSVTGRDVNQLTKAATRAEIVEFYEKLYGEIAENFAGHQERIDDLEGVTRAQEREVQDLADQNRDLRDVNNRASRRIRGLLGLIDEAHGEKHV